MMGENKTIKILIVDDEPDFINDLRSTLEKESYSVCTASDRNEAEEKVRSEEPDAIVLGTIMPIERLENG
jgi:DNA-binding response OmpR family regulator